MAGVFSNLRLSGQCAAPPAIGNPTVVHASCAGNGSITVPVSTAGNGNYHQYALYAGGVEVKPWQNSNIFTEVEAGTFEIRVRRVCPSQISTYVSRNVTVNNAFVAANITGITVNVTAQQCCDGRITVSATGSTPRQYALVTALNAPDLPVNLLTPKRSTTQFDSLCSGTHYVRVYDACGGYATQAITVGAYTTPISFGTNSYRRYSCDSLVLSTSLTNIRRRANTSDTAMIRYWITWPNGTTDTIPLGNSSNVSSGTLTLPFTYAKLNPFYNPALSFPDNIGSWPVNIVRGYRNSCGEVTLVNESIPYPGKPILNLLASRTVCDNSGVAFMIRHPVSLNLFGGTPTGGTGNLFINEQVTVSVNGGPWHPARTGYNAVSDTIWLANGQTYTIRVAYCGDTLSGNVTTPAAPPIFTTTVITVSGSNNSCTANVSTGALGSISPLTSNITVSIISAPAALSIIPAPVTIPVQANRLLFSNLPFGDYVFRISETNDADCPRSKDIPLKLVQNTLDGLTVYESDYNSCTGFTGIHILKTTTNLEGRPLTIQVLSQPPGAGIPPVFTYNLPTGSTYTPYNFPPEISNLIPGTYSFRLIDSTGTGCPRSIDRSHTILNNNYAKNTRVTYERACNGALTILHKGRLIIKAENGTIQTPRYGSFLKLELLDAANNIVWSGSGGAGAAADETIAVVPQATINALPNGTYTIRARATYSSSQGDCTIFDTTYIKAPAVINLSASRLYAGCNNNTSLATAVIEATGGSAPLTYQLYRNVLHADSAVSPPQLSNIFTGLNANTTYYVSVTDNCGFGNNIVLSSGEALTTSITGNTSNHCPGNTISLDAPVHTNVTYQWLKNGNPIAGATAARLTLANIQPGIDDGQYSVRAQFNDCSILSVAQTITVSCVILADAAALLTAIVKQRAVHLQWQSGTVQQQSIERSTDGSKWSTIFKDLHFEYQFTDFPPAPGKYWYRLKAQTPDGSYQFSASKTVQLNHQQPVNIYPNPTYNEVIITGLTGSRNQINIIDITGRIIKTIATGNTTASVPLQQLTAGLYLLSITDNLGNITTHKVEKK